MRINVTWRQLEPGLARVCIYSAPRWRNDLFIQKVVDVLEGLPLELSDKRERQSVGVHSILVSSCEFPEFENLLSCGLKESDFPDNLRTPIINL